MSGVVYARTHSPIGELLLAGDGSTLSLLHMLEGRHPVKPGADWRRDDDAFAGVRAQLAEYFDGGRTAFDVPLALEGTDFQRRVWEALREIPYGETVSYGELARRIESPRAVRAVGLANGRNPVAVIVPCHRVIGADGRLTGFGGGLERKRLLLELEAGRAAPALF
jgi:methylated-DNA-[protein]-cysteine S-methyltransferase